MWVDPDRKPGSGRRVARAIRSGGSRASSQALNDGINMECPSVDGLFRGQAGTVQKPMGLIRALNSSGIDVNAMPTTR